MKRQIIFLIAVISMFIQFGIAADAEENIRVVLNDKEIVFDAQPFIENGRTLVPIRAITEAMGCTVMWDASTGSALIQNSKRSVFIKVDGWYMIVQDYTTDKNSVIDLDVPATVHHDRTFIPLRAFSEAFDANVEWDGEQNLVTIKYGASYKASYGSSYGSLQGTSYEPSYGTAEGVEFRDEAIEFYVRKFLSGKLYWDGDYLYEGTITAEMLARVDIIDDMVLPDNVKIRSLEDIRMMPNLESLYLSKQDQITDISPIAYKSYWENIDLDGLIIKDDSALDNIRVGQSIYFPNGVGWISLADLDYRSALQAYRKVQDKIDFIGANYINSRMSDYDKYAAIHDYLVAHMEYDYDYFVNATTYSELYYGLIEGKGMCSVYASVYKYLCNTFGLECEVIDGDAKGIIRLHSSPMWMSHNWNIVKLNGKYYHVDVTWDDPLGGSGDQISREYFMLTDDQLNAFGNHVWSPGYGAYYY